MNIVVCIKQVPGTTNVKVNPETGTLIRDGVASKMNPFDLNALELGLLLKKEYGGTLKVISMGPPAALDIIREAIYMGADGGVLISDRKFGGADVLATSYTLCSGIKAMGYFDLILTGKQTTDGDTAQVGAELAEHLDIPHVANVTHLEYEDNQMKYISNLGEKIVTAKVTTPCLVCVDNDINTPRLPSFKRKAELKNCEDLIKIVTFNDIEDQDENHYGLKGSATKVERIFEPEKRSDKQMFVDGDLTKKVYEILSQKKFI
ncbi:MAG: electron transfer flavoprotein subunit beta/FixA family protein [Erysipelotrichaceae bacterium]|nr:electron transfer flavoprotein subunit beta/FixA family protein [Erysipelotrichaceae bacterium]